RDLTVTGVQTCALPICTLVILRKIALRLVRPDMSCCVNGPTGFCSASRTTAFRLESGIETSCAKVEAAKLVRTSRARTSRWTEEIGRASCRERVKMVVG